MNDSRRRVIGITALVLVVALLTSFGVWRLGAASRVGWAGFSYIPMVTSKKSGPPPMMGYKPGSVIMVYPGSPGERAGIDRGDQIVAINGIQSANMERIAALSASTRAGDTLTYTIRRNDTARTVRVRFESPLHSTSVVVVIVVNTAVAMTFLAIGIFVFLRRPADQRAIVFYVMTLIAAASFAAGALAQIDAANARGIMTQPTVASLGGSLSIAATAAFFAPLLLHLALVFPIERPVLLRRRRTVFQWIYGVPVYLSICVAAFLSVYALLIGAAGTHEKALVRNIGIVLLITITILVVAALVRIGLRIRRTTVREAFITSPFEVMTLMLALFVCFAGASFWLTSRTHSPASVMAMTILSIFGAIGLFAIYPVATVIALYRSYRESGAEERRQVKWPLWGTMVAVGGRIVLLFIGLAMGLMMAFGSKTHLSPILLTAPDVIAKSLYTLIPISFAIAIFKYRLMNIDVIIRRTVMYTMLTGVIFVLYAILVAGLGTALVKFGGIQNTTVLIASTAVIAIVAVPLRTKMQQLVDRNLFRERRDYPLALRNLGNAVATANEVDAFLRYSAEEIQQAVQNRFVLIAVRREREFVAAAKVGVADEILGSLRIAADSISFEAKNVPDALRRLGTTFVVPIAAHRQPVGLIALGRRLSDEEFLPPDVEFIVAAASQIGIGMESVRLRDEEVDFEQARSMQQILLPKSIPQLPGFEISGIWQPARSVGGDYFDVLALGAGRVGICIADVAGKGMPAALLMANLQAAVKATASRDAAPSAVCERVKTIVIPNLAGGKFISFFYAVLDAPTQTLTYCNAGHNPPVIARSGGTIERLMRGGPAVCRLFQDAVHEQETIELHSGDRLVLFTDGVSEARRGEEEFGEDRLIELLLTHRARPAKELQQHILAHLRDFTAGEYSDDVTMVVVSVD